MPTGAPRGAARAAGGTAAPSSGAAAARERRVRVRRGPVPAELHRAVDEHRARDLRWSCHHVASDCTAPDSIWAWISIRVARSEAPGCEVRGRVEVGGDQPRDDARRPGLDAGDERRDLGVGRVAEQRPPGLAALLDEAQERVDAVAQALLPRLAACGGRLEAAEDLGRLRVEERAVQLALGVEVLVDQRLRDARRVRDVVQRGAVVAAARERLLRGDEDDLAPLGGGHATTAGGRHDGPPVGGGWGWS